MPLIEQPYNYVHGLEACMFPAHALLAHVAMEIMHIPKLYAWLLHNKSYNKLFNRWS